MQFVEQRVTDPLTLTCSLTDERQVSYILYEDDGQSMAYQRGAFAETRVTCKLTDDGPEVTIEELHEHYKPTRTWYEVLVQSSERTLHQRVQAGQGKVTVRL